MSTDLIEGNVESVLKDLLARVAKLETAGVSIQEVSEIADDLGLFMVGELRVPFDYLDPKEPGEGFSGVRIMDQFEYPPDSGSYYAIVGVNNDALMFGLSAENGAGVFGGGNITLDVDGITGTDLLKWMISQTASVGDVERIGRVGYKSDGTKPVWTIEYQNTEIVDLLTNGDFEDSFTGWTKTTETNTAWANNLAPLYNNCACGYFLSSNINTDELVLTSDRIGVTELLTYLVKGSLYIYGFGYGGTATEKTFKLEIKWYDHATAGSLLSTDTLFSEDPTESHAWINYLENFTAPEGALSASIVLSGRVETDTGEHVTAYVYWDDISFNGVDAPQHFQLTDDGMQCTHGFYPDSAFGTFGQFKYFASDGTQQQMVNISLNTGSSLAGHLSSPDAAQAANSDYFTIKVPLVKGDYNFLMNYVRATDRGKVDFYFDGVNYGATKDLYGAVSYTEVWLVEAISAAYDGIHEVKIVVNGKNASSSDYRVAACDFIMYEDV